MFARIVRMNLQANSATEFARITENESIPLLRKQKGFRDQIAFVSTDKREVVAISLWDAKESAEAYERQAFPEVVKAVGKVTEGTPEVKTYEVSNSTFHKIAARIAA